jgi:hypothetical protein
MIKNSLVLLALAVLLLGSAGCKDKKKITDNPDPKEDVVKVDENLVKAKSTLQALLDDEGSKSIEEQEKILADIKALNLNDPEVNDLIKKVEYSIQKQKDDIRQAEEDAKPENVLRRSFDEITKAKNDVEANALIEKTLQLFTSEKSNVLIIISKGANFNDYDKPTNIKDYLNYLKDTRKNLNDIEKIHFGDNNKIKTLELIKK